MNKDVNISLQQRKNIEFSVFRCTDDILKNLLLQLPTSAIFYVCDDLRANEVFQFLSSSNVIGIGRVYKHTKLESKKNVLKEFNSQKLNYIVSEESLDPVERPDLRAVIFYGMPKYIEKLYKESMKVGANMSAKCIVIWSPQDIEMYQNLLYENCDVKKEGQSSPFVDYCNSLLFKMQAYCKESKCRRYMIGKYFDENYPPSNEIYDACCDNCQKIVEQRTPLNLLYEGFSADGSLNISHDLRTLLSIFNKQKKEGFIEKECLSILKGKKLEKPSLLEFFGIGQSKLEGYWKYILKFAIEKNYLKTLAPHQITITNDGMHFIRTKRKIIEIFANPELCNNMVRKNVSISIVNGKIIVKPKEETILQANDNYLEDFVFRNKENSLPDEDNNFFEFGVGQQKSVMKKRKIQEIENKVEKPKSDSDWREALAAALARKSDNSYFDDSKHTTNETVMTIESNQKTPIGNMSFNNQPQCSHWSFPPSADNNQLSSMNNIAFEELNDSQTEECKKDEEQEIAAYVTTMISVRNKIKKPLEMPLSDLLEYIEKTNTYDQGAS